MADRVGTGDWRAFRQVDSLTQQMHLEVPVFRSRTALTTAALCLALALTPLRARAQEPVAADPAATLYRAALTLEAEQAYDLADALMDHILRHYPESEAAAAIRRARARPESRRLDSSGRTELVVWSTLYGLWLGVAVPGMFGADSPEPFGLGLLVGGPLGLWLSLASTKDRPISDGTASAISFGGTWGTWQGLGWAEVLASSEVCPDIGGCYDEDPSGQTVVGYMVGGGLLGLAAATGLARRRDITPGTATTVSLAAMWGTWYGYTASVLAGFDDGHGGITSALLGGDLGLLVGAGIAQHSHPTRNRARIVSIAGVAGALAGLGLDLLVQPNDGKAAIAIPAATSALGLLAGSLRKSAGDTDPSEREIRNGGREWDLGGPVLPTFRKDDGGRVHPALAVTLLSARF